MPSLLDQCIAENTLGLGSIRNAPGFDALIDIAPGALTSVVGLERQIQWEGPSWHLLIIAQLLHCHARRDRPLPKIATGGWVRSARCGQHSRGVRSRTDVDPTVAASPRKNGTLGPVARTQRAERDDWMAASHVEASRTTDRSISRRGRVLALSQQPAPTTIQL